MRKFLLSIALFAPVTLYAQTTSIKSIADTFSTVLVSSIIGFLLVGAGAAFFYGVARYVYGYRNGDPATIKEGNKFLLWGGIALFVMGSFWGIITFVQGQFGLGGDIRLPSTSIRSNPYAGTSVQGVRTQSGAIVSAVAQPKRIKAEASSGACLPDADGTTYRENPTNRDECIPDSPCGPGYTYNSSRDVCVDNDAQTYRQGTFTCGGDTLVNPTEEEFQEFMGECDSNEDTFSSDTNGDGQINVYDDGVYGYDYYNDDSYGYDATADDGSIAGLPVGGDISDSSNGSNCIEAGIVGINYRRYCNGVDVTGNANSNAFSDVDYYYDEE